jgi:hypothetical protein
MEIDPQAIEVQGNERSYLVEPSRVDVEWLRAVGDWYRDEANRLEERLAR